ncbi:18123_t:CDS:2 [Entrophospora sp. SA101]|nr:18123_t:CDS:2 [Entrophospora sp. SA101]
MTKIIYEITELQNYSATTVTRIIKNFQERDGVKELSKSGRLKHLSVDHKNELKKIVKKENRKSAE